MSRLRDLADAISLLPDVRAQLESTTGDPSRDREWAAAYAMRAHLFEIIDVDCAITRHISSTASSVYRLVGDRPRIHAWVALHPQRELQSDVKIEIRARLGQVIVRYPASIAAMMMDEPPAIVIGSET